MIITLDSYCPECFQKAEFRCHGDGCQKRQCSECKAVIPVGSTIGVFPGKTLEETVTLEKIREQIERLKKDVADHLTRIEATITMREKLIKAGRMSEEKSLDTPS
jgi:hypothetical protein